MHVFVKNILSREELKDLAEIITEAEKFSSGQIRVVIRHRRHWKERQLSLHELAVREFHRLGMEKTREKTGVLILLLLSERRFQIIGDEGIHSKVDEKTWDRIAHTMTNHFGTGKFFNGIAEAIHAVGEELGRHFPRTKNDTDELPNDVIEQ